MSLSRTKTYSLIIAMALILSLGLLLGTDVQAAATDGLTAAEKNSSYGFFLWLSEKVPADADKEDAKIAAQILKNNLESKYNSIVFNNGNITASAGSDASYEKLLAATSLGAENDATSLDALKESINFVTLGNEYRAKESLAPLTISSGLMAMAELDANYQPTTWGHPLVFNGLENLAYYGTTGGVINHDPYEGWYTKEKINFDTNNGDQTGHYKTLTDRQGVMKHTGFGTKLYYNAPWNDKYYSQFFGNSSLYNVGNGFTPDQYLDYLKEYQCSVVGHEMEKTQGKAHTCTEDGTITYYTCKNCGKKFSDEAGNHEVTDIKDPAPGHSWNTEYTIDKEASCKEEGSKSIHCSECGEIKEGSTVVIEKIDHKWDKGTITSPITLTNLVGEKEFICQVCKEKKTEEITVDASYVEGWINELPQNVTLDDKTTVTRIREIYEGLDAAEQAKVSGEALKKLRDAEESIKTEEKLKEDRIEAGKVAALISNMDPSDKTAVYEAKNAYEELSDAQKNLLDQEDVNKLNDAISAIEEKERTDQEAANQVTALIENMDPTDKESVEIAKAAYDALSPDQKKLISEANKQTLSDAVDKLMSEEEKLRIDQEAADQVVALIEQMDPTSRESVNEAKAAYDALFEDQKALVSPEALAKLNLALDNLEAVDEKIRQDKAAANGVTALILNMDINDRTSVQEAKEAFEGLSEDQKKYVSEENRKLLSDTVKALQAIMEAEEKQKTDQAAADKVISLIQTMNISDKASVTAVKAAYDALSPDQKKLISDESINKLTAALNSFKDDETDVKKPETDVKQPATKATKAKEKQTLTLKVSKKSVKVKKLKKKAQKVSPITVKSAVGTVSYKITGGKKKARKVLKINAGTGKITIKKGTKKGTYKVKVTVSAAGNSQYYAGSQTVEVSIKVK